jgi:hypothetical protein
VFASLFTGVIVWIGMAIALVATVALTFLLPFLRAPVSVAEPPGSEPERTL